MKYHSSWPSPAIVAFEKAIVAHGGWQAWSDFDEVTLKLREFRGFLLDLKGFGKTFSPPIDVTINPKNKRVAFNYGAFRDTYRNGALIFSPEQKHVADGRTLFSRSVFEKWQPQHALYFFGYAWANYIGYPFILPEFELMDWKIHKLTSWFKIRFPDGLHAHSRIQKFYFDSNSRLFRNDYRADYAGSIFYGAHFTEDYQSYKGLQISCLRNVRRRSAFSSRRFMHCTQGWKFRIQAKNSRMPSAVESFGA